MAAEARNRTTALVIDDDEQIGRLIKECLSDVDTETLKSRAELMERLKQPPVDAVLLDWRLQDGDGISLIDSIRDAWPETSIILITGFTSEEIIIRAIKRGAFYFLSKPFNTATLRQTVKRATENTRICTAAMAARTLAITNSA